MDTTLIRYERAEPLTSESTAWIVFYEDAVVGRIGRYTSLRRGYSKSQMSTSHYEAWRGSVGDAALDDIDRRAVQREIKFNKTSRAEAAKHLIGAYERSGVDLPTVAAVQQPSPSGGC